MTVYLNCYFIEYYTIYLTQCYKSQFFTLQYLKNDLNVQTLVRCYPNKGTITKKIVCSSQSNQLWSWLGTLKNNNIIIRSASMQWWFWFWYSWNSQQRPRWGTEESVNFHNVSALNLISYLCSEFYGHDWLQTCRYKTRVLWRSFAKVREKSVFGFWNYWHFL